MLVHTSLSVVGFHEWWKALHNHATFGLRHPSTTYESIWYLTPASGRHRA